MSTVLKIENLTKNFRIYHDKKLKEALVSFVKRRPSYTTLIALKDINVEVEKGQCLGIIGPNGSGKSTLLKLIAGILYPDKGKIYTNGKISTLIEINAGLHEDLTGIENIYLNAALYGLTKKQIRQNLNKIIDFAELGNFIDTQTRFYSDGMRARLGFSVAIHVNADILLVDEVLAVGDEQFREKCYKKIDELRRNGVSIVYVSHELDSIKKICDSVIFICNSTIIIKGSPAAVIDKYVKGIKP